MSLSAVAAIGGPFHGREQVAADRGQSTMLPECSDDWIDAFVHEKSSGLVMHDDHPMPTILATECRSAPRLDPPSASWRDPAAQALRCSATLRNSGLEQREDTRNGRVKIARRSRAQGALPHQ